MKKLLSLLLVASLLTSSLSIYAQENKIQENKIEEIALHIKKAVIYSVVTGCVFMVNNYSELNYHQCSEGSVINSEVIIANTLVVLGVIQSASHIISAIYKTVKKNNIQKEKVYS